MQLGVAFPQDTTMLDPGAVREYAQAVEAMGYDFVHGGEHVLGADTTNRPDWSGPYDIHNVWREPFALHGFLAACTSRVTLGTSILVLPLRQTALVAKQAAEVDVLSNGRFRLGIGVGWNEIEFEAMGMDARTRGKRTEEQIEVLRALWTQESVSFRGTWHTISDAGINPLPVQRPIPIWFGGGGVDTALRRVARLGDGWIPPGRHGDTGPIIEKFRGYLKESSRDASKVAIAGRHNIAGCTPDDWVAAYQGWRAIGATHLSASTNGAGVETADDHIATLRRFMETVSPLPQGEG
jgi:probable F420-dependent oxidoreductase